MSMWCDPWQKRQGFFVCMIVETYIFACFTALSHRIVI